MTEEKEKKSSSSPMQKKVQGPHTERSKSGWGWPCCESGLAEKEAQASWPASAKPPGVGAKKKTKTRRGWLY
jgi:hypothetical protein